MADQSGPLLLRTPDGQQMEVMDLEAYQDVSKAISRLVLPLCGSFGGGGRGEGKAPRRIQRGTVLVTCALSNSDQLLPGVSCDRLNGDIERCKQRLSQVASRERQLQLTQEAVMSLAPERKVYCAWHPTSG